MSDYLQILEKAIQFGYPVLLQNVQEYLDPTLNPVLNKSVTRIGGGPGLLWAHTVGCPRGQPRGTQGEKGWSPGCRASMQTAPGRGGSAGEGGLVAR